MFKCSCFSRWCSTTLCLLLDWYVQSSQLCMTPLCISKMCVLSGCIAPYCYSHISHLNKRWGLILNVFCFIAVFQIKQYIFLSITFFLKGRMKKSFKIVFPFLCLVSFSCIFGFEIVFALELPSVKCSFKWFWISFCCGKHWSQRLHVQISTSSIFKNFSETELNSLTCLVLRIKSK